jgi:hypothetical protein
MTAERQLPIEDWFWDLIQECRPVLKNLEKRLEAMPRDQLEKYMVYYDIASEHICEPWDGPYIDESVGNLSEDGTEDLTDWIVSQGRSVWEYALSPRADFKVLFYLSVGEEPDHDLDIAEWCCDVAKESHEGWQQPKDLARIIYEERFGVEYFDVQEELHERYDPA